MRAGDMVYIHFSGHGQLVTYINGDEDDGWDEAKIPYDAYLRYDAKGYKGDKHLIDDEVNLLRTNIKKKIGSTGTLLVVMDACHSGDSSCGKDIGETVRDVKDEFVIPGSHNGKAKKAKEQWLR